MIRRMICGAVVATTLASMALPPVARAQRLYNKERDEQAQKALELAEPLKNGALFEAQLKNLSTLAKRDIETEFMALKSTVVSDSLIITTWGRAHRYVCTVQSDNTGDGLLPSAHDIKQASDELTASITAAKESLKAFQKEVKDNEVEIDPALVSLFDRLGDLKTVEEFAAALQKQEVVNTETVEAIGRLKEVADVLKGVYDTYKEKVKAYNELAGELAELRMVLKKVAIQSLQVDEEHLKNIAAIRARRETERGDLLSLISQYKGIVERLGLVQFNETAANRAGRFCGVVEAAKRADDSGDGPPDLNWHLVIADHLRELVERAKSMEEDNRTTQRQARSALAALTTGRAAADDISRTVDALNVAAAHIRARAPIHGSEGLTAKELEGARDSLRAAADAHDRAAAEKALRVMIVQAQRQTLRHRDMVADIPQALYVIAALIARGSTPSSLAEIRFAQELHAYSVRKSAVRARAYELTLSTGAKRLSLFHKGGIKPTDVAELVFAVSNVAITPAILAR